MGPGRAKTAQSATELAVQRAHRGWLLSTLQASPPTPRPNNLRPILVVPISSRHAHSQKLFVVALRVDLTRCTRPAQISEHNWLLRSVDSSGTVAGVAEG